ncbi:MAG TPA: NmrA family NAD(P)-binding protein [Streptosporangiaceae bacterium]|nr:NmrA family NAD(P)-binding protein [Streptosporangiaceae bacterium]
MTFLLIGATGQVGSVVARTLVAGGHQVRALVRDPDAAAAKLGPGIEYVRGDLNDRATLPGALKGVDAAYLATAPAPEMVRQEGNFIDAAAAAGLPRLVELSVLGTDVSVPIFKFHQDIEAKIANSGIPATVLRPGGFYSSFLFSAEAIRAGALPSAAGDGRIAWIDPADVAGVATAVLLEAGVRRPGTEDDRAEGADV